MNNWRKVLAWQIPQSAIMMWDYKEAPDPKEVTAFIAEGLHYFYQVPDTGSDQDAWIACATPLRSKQQIQKIFEQLEAQMYGEDFDE